MTMKIKGKLIALITVLFLGANSVFSQEYKGLWGRLEYEPGLSLNNIPNELSEIKGTGIYTYGYAFTIGYHFERWSVGLGGNASAHLSPSRFAYLGMFLEGTYRPFDAILTPLAFNIRAGLPVANPAEFKVKMNTSVSVSWALRNKLWNAFGAEISAGIGYTPYAVDIITFVPKQNGPSNYNADQIVKPHNLSKVNAFLRLAVTIN